MAKMKQIVECVPNFSEGRDMGVIRQITDAVESVKGVKLLDVDPGEATNRTVVTFVGEPTTWWRLPSELWARPHNLLICASSTALIRA